jgi:YD repeat-containing protein
LGTSSLFYAYNTSNRLASLTGSKNLSYTYDAYGNVTSDSVATYTFDDASNLRCVNCADPNNKIEYSYLPQDRRVSVNKAVPPMPTTPLTVDNTDTASIVKVGSWPVSTSQTGYIGSNYQSHAAATASTDSFTWNVSVPVAGTYQVFARWTAYPNRTSDAPYTITHSAGVATVPVDQRSNGGDWVSLGTYNFNAGVAAIALGVSATGYSIADAVQLVAIPPPSGKTYEAYAADGTLLIEHTPANANKLVEYIYLNGKRIAQRVTP